MQAIIMAAGVGSRLGDLTKDKPKAFLEIKGKKLIEYNLDVLRSFGIEDVTIVTGYMCEKFEELTKDMPGVRCVFNPFYETVNVLGSFYIGQEYLKDDDLIYLHADTLADPAIFRRMIESDSDIVMPVDFKECDEEAMKVRTDSGKITEVSKRIPLNLSEGEFIGICKIKKEIIPSLKAVSKQLLKKKELNSYFEAAIQELIDQDKVDVLSVPTDGDFWIEIDFVEDYEKAIKDIPKLY